MGQGAYRAAFLAFLGFLKVNLNGQTPHRQDILWASQLAIVQGFAQFAVPDLLCREDRLAEDLGYLARNVATKADPPPNMLEDTAPVPLAAIHDGELEAAARDAYQRDYVTFGFAKWRPRG